MASSKRWGIAQFAERKWWQYYLRRKDVQEYLAWKRTYWQGIHLQVSQHIDVASHKIIADVGCGPAGIFMHYHGTHVVTAVDPLLDSYEHDLPHFKRNMYPQVHFLNAGLETFTLKQEFDVVYCLNAINHVQDIALGYRNLCEAIKPGGYLVVSIDAHNYQWLKKIFQLIPGDILHPHQYDSKEYEGFAQNFGLHLLHQQLVKREGIFSYYMQIFTKPKS